MNVRDLVLAAIHDLGKPDTGVVFESGCVTSRGAAWEHLEVEYQIEESEAMMLGAAPLVSMIRQRRRDAFMRLEMEMWNKFSELIGAGDPAKWRIVGLENWWLREGPRARVRGVTVYMTRVFAFDQVALPTDKPIIVEGSDAVAR